MTKALCRYGDQCINPKGASELRSARTLALGICSLCLKAGRPGDGPGVAAGRSSSEPRFSLQPALDGACSDSETRPLASLLLSPPDEEGGEDWEQQVLEEEALPVQLSPANTAANTSQRPKKHSEAPKDYTLSKEAEAPPPAVPHPSSQDSASWDGSRVSDFEKRILRAATELSVAQMDKNDVEDFIGLSNADYRHGYLLSALEDSVSLAALLYRYPRQTASYGLSNKDLVEFLRQVHKKDINPSYERTTMKALEDQSRAATRSLIAAQRDPALGSKVRLMGSGLDKEALKILLLEGQKDEHGILVPKERLSYLRQKLGAKLFANNSTIDSVVAETPQKMHENATIERLEQKKLEEARVGPKNGSKIIMQVNGERGVFLKINWNAPFSENGVTVRNEIKKHGCRWDSIDSSWLVEKKRAGLLKLALSNLSYCDASAIPDGEALSEAEIEELAEIAQEDQTGVLYVKIKPGSDPAHLRLFVRKRNGASDALWNAVKQVGGLWDGSDKTMVVEKSGIPALLHALDGNEQLVLTSLLPIVEESNQAQLRKLQVNQQKLKDMAAKVPTTTPSGATIRDYQREGIGFLLSSGLLADSVAPAADGQTGLGSVCLTTVVPARQAELDVSKMHAHGAILADDMGLGKTLQSIMAAMIKYPSASDKKLVVCPSSAKINWKKELVKWLGPEAEKRIFIMRGRKAKIPEGTEWCIVNYDITLDNINELKGFAAKLAILDEAQHLRNFNTRKGVALVGRASQESGHDNRKDGILGPIKDVWAMSGTPLMNRIDDLFNLLVAIKHPLAKSKNRFLSRYMDKWTKKARHLDELGDLLGSVMLRRMKENVLDLPPKIRLGADYEMTKNQQEAYHSHLSSAVDRATTDIEVITAMKVHTAKIKIPITLERLEEILSAGDTNKVLVFSEYLEVLNQVEKAYPGMCVRIDGSVSEKKRDEAVTAFQDNPGIRIFVGQMKSASEAITLTAANHVVFNDKPWVPNTLNQAEDRAYRFGQKSSVFIHNITLLGSFDEKLLEVLDAKRSLISTVEGRAIAKASEVTDRASVMSQMLDYVSSELKGARREKFDAMRNRERKEHSEQVEKMRVKMTAPKVQS